MRKIDMQISAVGVLAKMGFLCFLWCPLGLIAQPYLGGEGSGVSNNQVLSCAPIQIFAYASGSSNSGSSSNSVFYCADSAKYRGSGIASGSSVSTSLANCDTFNQRFLFHSSANRSSGANFSAVNYCVPLATLGSQSGGFGFNSVYYCVPLATLGSQSSGFGFNKGDCLVPLPIGEIIVDAFPRGMTSVLIWQTFTEVNTDYFSIEKSVDGENFVELSRKKAAGNSTEILQYQYVDENPVMGKNFYRIKQYDYFGTLSVSEIKEVEFFQNESSSTPMIIYPNPIKDGQTLNIWLANGFEGSLELMDNNGRAVSRIIEFTESSEPQIFHLDTSNFAKGIYLVLLKTNKGIFSHKLVVF